MRFENVYFLFLFLLVPILGLFYVFIKGIKKSDMQKFAQEQLYSKISFVSGDQRIAKSVLQLFAICFLILALARPQFGTKIVETTHKGIDVVIAVDVSKSMLAEDIKPNRIDKAKMLMSDLIKRLKGNRIGIIAFAGTAFWQCPLTLDAAGAQLFMHIMNTNLLPLPGTVVGDAIRVAVKGLNKSTGKSKVIVLLTDGEDHESNPIEAGKEAAKDKIKIYTLGIGTPDGEPIPIKDETGKFLGYKKDVKGDIVMSKLDEKALVQVAQETGGKYFRITNQSDDIGALVNAIQGLEKNKLSSKKNKQMEDRYQYILALALLLLIAEYFILGYRK